MAPKKDLNEDLFKQAFNEVPDCVGIDHAQVNNIEDLRWACLTQLDLIESGQDGTENDDPKTIKRWFRKWGRPKGT